MLAGWADRWPVLAIRGAMAVLFGLMAILWPGVTVVTLVMLFGAYVMASGILSGVLALTRQPPEARWLLALEAVVGIIAGLVFLSTPGLTTLTLLYVIGAYAILAGGARIVQAIRLRKELTNEWALGISGGLEVLMGILVLARPGAGAVALAWTLGVLAIAFGVAELVLANRLRTMPARGAVAGPRLWTIRSEEAPEVTRERTRR